jgi:cytochrome bd-type quinol oxidase subunit 2
LTVAVARRALVCVALFVAPVPYAMLEVGVVTPARLLLLGTLTAGIWVQDPDPLSAIFAGALLGQGLVWSALLYGAIRLATKRSSAASPRARAWFVVVISAALVGVALFPIYRTPLSTSGVETNLLQIFD